MHPVNIDYPIEYLPRLIGLFSFSYSYIPVIRPVGFRAQTLNWQSVMEIWVVTILLP